MDNLFQLKPGDTVWYPVLSGSMAPFFLPGDEVLIRIIDPGNPGKVFRAGRVIIFFQQGKFSFHRILIFLPYLFWIYQKGDANKSGSWISVKRVIGVAEGHRRTLKSNIIELPIYSRIRTRAILELFKIIMPFNFLRSFSQRTKI